MADNGGRDSGCPYTGPVWPRWVLPDGTPEADQRKSECYPHDSLVTSSNCVNHNCDKAVTWRYYTPTRGIIWDAPEGIPEVCYGQNALNNHQACSGTQFTNHVILPNQGTYDSAPILDDIANCNLAQISYVIPDRVWSDHPGGKWSYSVLHKFSGPDGNLPWGVIVDSKGNLYGTTSAGGKYNAGVAFEITP